MRPPTLAWIAYISAVCGCIASVALKGICKISVNSLSAITSRMGILTVTPASDYLGASDFNPGQLFGIVIFFGLGAFVSGLVLTAQTVDGTKALMKLDYPTITSWTWSHQLLITICIISLAVSDSIVINEASNVPAYLSGQLPKSASFVFAVLLLSFTSSIMSTFLTLHQVPLYMYLMA